LRKWEQKREREREGRNRICEGVGRGISCAERLTSSSWDRETIEETMPLQLLCSLSFSPFR